MTSLLAGTRDKRLVLVTGQAAQGKSTLAAEYVGTLAEPFAWINLDRDDSDPTNLFLWMIRAMQTACPDVDFSPLFSVPSSSMGPRAPGPMFREWAGAMLSRVTLPMQFVLDGLDRLDGEGAAFELLRVFIEDTPPGFRWLVLSRSRPPLEIERWEMNRLAVTIGNESLAFSAKEIKALGRRLYRYDLEAHQVRMMLEFTEGWVGGLIIMLDSFQQNPNPQNGLDLLTREAERSTGRVFPYLAEQVLDRLPGKVRKILTITSIFNTIEPRLAEQLTGESGLESLFQGLVDRNFFVTGHYDTRRGVRYRYHQLFRAFLQTRFEVELGPAEQSRWLTRAAELSVAHGDLEDALQLFLKAGSLDKAAGLLRKLGVRLLKEGRIGDLLRWISALPEESVRKDPWLTTYLCTTRRYTASGKNIQDLSRAAVMFREADDFRGRLTALAFLIEAQTAYGTYCPETIRESLELLTNERPNEHQDEHPFERGNLWHQIGFAETLHGDYTLAYNACQNAIMIGRQLDNGILLANARANSVTILTFLGKFDQLDEVSRNMDLLPVHSDNREVHCLYTIARSLARIFRGDPESGLELIEETLKEIEVYGLYYLRLPALIYRVIGLAYLERMEAAEQAATEAIFFSRTIGNDFMETVTGLFWGISFYRCGRFEKAEEHLQEALDHLRSGRVIAPHHEISGTQVVNLVRLGKGAAPELDDMRRAHRGFETSGSALLKADSSLALALAFDAEGEYDQAVRYLAEGLTLTSQYGYDFFIFLSSNDAARACSLAVAYEMTDSLDEVSRLLCGRFAEEAPDHLKLLLKHRKPQVRERARNLLQKIRRLRLPKINIQTLGEFTVHRGEAPLPEDSWTGGMPKSLLKTIIALGPRRVTRDVIMDALWPEASSKAAGRNFKIALHRLRRALEPDMDPLLGSTYINLKENVVTLTDWVAEIDLELFEHSALQAVTAAAQGKPAKAIAAYEKAIQAYSGPFLAENLYDDWAVTRRDEIRFRFLKIHLEKAKLHDGLGHFRKAAACYRQVLELDPIHEETCRKLMNLYAAHGRRNEAIKVFQRLRQCLLEDFGGEPEKMTTFIYDKIREAKS